jgi:hypothetical protein
MVWATVARGAAAREGRAPYRNNGLIPEPIIGRALWWLLVVASVTVAPFCNNIRTCTTVRVSVSVSVSVSVQSLVVDSSKI